MIIGIWGYAKSGKDTTAEIIQELTAGSVYELTHSGPVYKFSLPSIWQVKKFAGKLKQVASILTGIPAEDFEKQEVKDSHLPQEWNKIVLKPRPRQDGFGPRDEDDFEIKKMTVREFLQILGTEGIRDSLHKNAWVNALFSEYEPLHSAEDDECPKWIITDVRFPNEANAIRERGGRVIRINRNGVRPVNGHSSETALDGYNFDYVLENNGTPEDLKAKVKTMLHEFGIETH